MKTKLVVIFLSLSISLVRKCFFVILVFSFLMQVSCRKDDIPVPFGTATIGNTSSLMTMTGNTYYVSPTGGNTNTGTINSPFKTINYGVSKLKAGDNLYIRGGSYNEKVLVSVSGSSTNRIVISGYPGETAIIDGQYSLPGGTIYNFLVRVTGDYITFKDVTITRSNGSLFQMIGQFNIALNIKGNGSYETGFDMRGDHNVFDGCSMTDNGNRYGINGQTTWGSAIGGGGTNNIFQNCIAYDNKGEGLNFGWKCSNCIIQDCISYDNYSVGIYCDESSGTIVRRNLVYCSVGARYRPSSGIVLAGESGHPTNLTIINNICYGNYINLMSDSNVEEALNWTIANNTFVNSQKTAAQISVGYNMGIYFRSNLVSFTNSIFANNIVIEEANNQVPINNNLTNPHVGFTFSNNCWNKTPTTKAQGTGDVVGDPKLTKTGSLNAGELTGDYFKLLSTSPAINKGSAVTQVTDDYFRNARDVTPDVGAQEYKSTDPTIKITGISVTGAGGANIITINKGTLQLSAAILPTDATNKTVIWSISNGTGQASINSSGLVTAISNGTATARATANDGSGVYGTLLITISNQVIPANPINLSSAIENATPSLLEMTYDLSLANIVPAANSFSVMVNSLTRTVNTVAISGTKVLLTLSSPVAYGNTVTVSYTKPSTNPLQTTSGGQAETCSGKSVINNVSPCINETFTAVTGTVTDNSGTSNYINNMSCDKLIQPSGGGTITLTFTSFNTEAGYDYVKVYAGSTTAAPLLGTFSGTSLPPVLISSAGSMLIRFTTDGGVVAPGWSATYTSGLSGSCINETFTASTGTVTDNSGTSNYINNMSCDKLIQPSGGGTITLTFTSFNTEAGYDYVKVYAGSTTAAPLLGTFSGTSQPPVLISSSGSMLIRFTTDGGVVAPGWSATYTSGLSGSCINETFTAATGTVTDNSGISNYINNMSCDKLIQPSGGGTITLTFTSFNTEAGYDFVKVYDGPTISSPLMGTFSGTSLPPILKSTGGSMLIRFTTDGGVVAPGWSASYISN